LPRYRLKYRHVSLEGPTVGLGRKAYFLLGSCGKSRKFFVP
jgi:hypothetical protein